MGRKVLKKELRETFERFAYALTSIYIIQVFLAKYPDILKIDMWLSDFLKIMRDAEGVLRELKTTEEWKDTPKEFAKQGNAIREWLGRLEKEFSPEEAEVMTLEQACKELRARAFELGKKSAELATQLGIIIW